MFGKDCFTYACKSDNIKVVISYCSDLPIPFGSSFGREMNVFWQRVSSVLLKLAGPTIFVF